MTLLCAECGYDVSELPEAEGMRLCPECGVRSRGLAPDSAPWWVFRRALRPALIWAAVLVALWSVALVLERLSWTRNTSAPLVFRILWGVTTFYSFLAAFASAVTWTGIWGDSLPRRNRGWKEIAVGAAVILVNMSAIASLTVLLVKLMPVFGFEPLDRS